MMMLLYSETKFALSVASPEVEFFRITGRRERGRDGRNGRDGRDGREGRMQIALQNKKVVKTMGHFSHVCEFCSKSSAQTLISAAHFLFGASARSLLKARAFATKGGALPRPL